MGYGSQSFTVDDRCDLRGLAFKSRADENKSIENFASCARRNRILNGVYFIDLHGTFMLRNFS